MTPALSAARELIARAHAAGLRLTPERGGKVAIRDVTGARPSGRLVQELRANKPLLLAYLTGCAECGAPREGNIYLCPPCALKRRTSV